MLVAHDQVPRSYNQAAHLDRNIYLHQMHIGVGNGYAVGEEMKPCLSHLVLVPHRAIGNSADATQDLVYVGIDLAPEGPNNRMVNVMYDNNSRLWYPPYPLPPLWRLNSTALRRVSTDDSGSSVTYHWP